MDIAYEEDQKVVPVPRRTQKVCLLIGAGGTGKTTIILTLLLEVFVLFFPPVGGEDRYLITTFSHAQSDAISNEKIRANTAHSACSYRVASLRNTQMALKTKEKEMQQRWMNKVLLIQDEISLVPAMVQNMLLYRIMRARQDHGLQWETYALPDYLFGKMPIVIIAGDFLQIKPANEISLADNMLQIAKAGKRKIFAEHQAGQDSVMQVADVVHLKTSKRFQDKDMPAVTSAMRQSRPDKPMAESALDLLRTRKIESCKTDLQKKLFRHGHVLSLYWENIARSMVERAHRDARELNVPLFCLQAADKRHSRANKDADKQLTHQLLTVPNLHRTGRLQGMLLVHENMVMRFSDVLSPELGLVKDKLVRVIKVDFHQKDEERLRNLPAGYCHFVPDFMAKGIWVQVLNHTQCPLKQELLEHWQNHSEADAAMAADAGSMLFVEIAHSEFKIELTINSETENISVIRWQFPLTHGMLRTAYAAQGLTLEGGVVMDLRRAGGLEDDDWWLAIYVMISRARKLENIILLST